MAKLETLYTFKEAACLAHGKEYDDPITPEIRTTARHMMSIINSPSVYLKFLEARGFPIDSGFDTVVPNEIPEWFIEEYKSVFLAEVEDDEAEDPGEETDQKELINYQPRKPIYRLAKRVMEDEFKTTGEIITTQELLRMMPDYDPNNERFVRYNPRNKTVVCRSPKGEEEEISLDTFNNQISQIRTRLKALL